MLAYVPRAGHPPGLGPPALDHRRRRTHPVNRPGAEHARARLGLAADGHSPRPVHGEPGPLRSQVDGRLAEQLDLDAVLVEQAGREGPVVPVAAGALAGRAEPPGEPQPAAPLGAPLVEVPPALDVGRWLHCPVRGSAGRRAPFLRRGRGLRRRRRVRGAPDVHVPGPGAAREGRLGAAVARAVRCRRRGRVAGRDRHPLEMGARGGRVAREVGAARASDRLEAPFAGLHADLDVDRAPGPADHQEVLAIGAVDGDVEVVVRVRPIEGPAGRVVDAEAAPPLGPGGPQAPARGGEAGVGDLPVQVRRLRIAHHHGDAVLAVAPGQLAGVDGRDRTAQRELRRLDALVVGRSVVSILAGHVDSVPRSRRTIERSDPEGSS